MIIKDKNIGVDFKPYIIAELSANHGGSLTRAKESIKAAAKTGVSAVKIQTYTPDTMTINCDKPDFFIKEGIWAGSQIYDLYKSAYTPYEWHAELFDYAKQNDITLISSPFDETAVDLLEENNVPAYKIASFEIIDIPLLKYIAKKNKPMLISTGMSNLLEIEEAIDTIRSISDLDILLFHCVSSYPAKTKDLNLNFIKNLRDKFGVNVGLSDHTTTNMAAITAIGIGAVAIEKHFKLDNKDCGPDSSFSLTIDELSSLVEDCNEAWKAKGESFFNRSESEKRNIKYRRSIYFVENLMKGEEIQQNHIRRIRPGYGLSPKYFENIIGKKVNRDITRGEPVKWEDLS